MSDTNTTGNGTTETKTASHEGEPNRRAFLHLTTGAFAAIGAANIAWPLIDQMNPSADVLALASTELDLSKIEVGQSITIKWRGKPVFVRRRTAEEIKIAEAVTPDQLPDPQADTDRVKKSEWLVLLGVCTHLGCVPLGQKPSEFKGEFGGWFCPCHGSHYDSSGRIRKGPAPRNLEIPPYEFLNETSIKIG